MKKSSFQQELPPSLQKLLALKTQTCQTKETNRTMVLVIIEWKTSSQFFVSSFRSEATGDELRQARTIHRTRSTANAYGATARHQDSSMLTTKQSKIPLKEKLKWDPSSPPKLCKLRTRNKHNVILQITQEPLPLAHYKGVHWQQRKQFRVLGT